jgi:hypothetical protein
VAAVESTAAGLLASTLGRFACEVPWVLDHLEKDVKLRNK